uniref:Uncharacterized protein n=1 Tax=Macrostomum lignano TaxID=282301 RepID=A0A1I8FC09_9PLAT
LRQQQRQQQRQLRPLESGKILQPSLRTAIYNGFRAEPAEFGSRQLVQTKAPADRAVSRDRRTRWSSALVRARQESLQAGDLCPYRHRSWPAASAEAGPQRKQRRRSSRRPVENLLFGSRRGLLGSLLSAIARLGRSKEAATSPCIAQSMMLALSHENQDPAERARMQRRRYLELRDCWPNARAEICKRRLSLRRCWLRNG